MGEMKTGIWERKNTPTDKTNKRDACCFSQKFRCWLISLFQEKLHVASKKKKPASKQAHNNCRFMCYVSDAAKGSNSCTLLSRQVTIQIIITIPDNLFVPLGRQSHGHLLVTSGTSSDIFQTVYSLLEGVIVQHRPCFLMGCPKGMWNKGKKTHPNRYKTIIKVINQSNGNKEPTGNSCQLL